MNKIIKFFEFSTVRYLKNILLLNYNFRNNVTKNNIRISNIPLIANNHSNLQIDIISRSSTNLATASKSYSQNDSLFIKSWLF
jgi:hypothetical protein